MSSDTFGIGPLIILLAAVGFGIVFFGFLYAKALFEHIKLRPFQPYIGEYTNLPKLKEINTTPYVKGKIITVNTSKNTLDDPVYFKLPKDLRAAKPEEVETIVWLERDRLQTGSYGVLPAFTQVCQVTIIDKSQQVILARKLIEGSEPPSEVEVESYEASKLPSEYKRTGSLPVKEVVDFLIKLPRRG